MTRRTALLAVLVAADIGVLLALRLSGTGGLIELVGQAVLVVAFAALALLDLRAAVAIVVLELALGGASGRWSVYGGVVSARIVLDTIVFGVALWRLAQARDRPWRERLGRYGVHALIVAVLLPAIWIPLGVLNGWRPADAWGDGNGYLFFAFALVPAALATSGDLGWLRRWLLVACSATAVLTAGLAIVAVFIAPDFIAVRKALLLTLDQGGAIAVTDEYLRLALGSGLYLVVGIALVAWEVVANPRRVWPWVLVALFAIALLSTYTRALWLAGGGAVLIVALLGTERLRGAVLAGGMAALMLASAGLFAVSAGWPYPGYLLERVSSVASLPRDDINALEAEMAMGETSNAIKIHQAKVLFGHIVERPLHGFGFGAIAPDYRYAQIYSYELSYIALVYKAGIVGLLLFLSLPVRLLWDALRMRLGRLKPPAGVTVPQAAVPIAIVGVLLAVGATNPFLVASFGLAPIVLTICWLDAFRR